MATLQQPTQPMPRKRAKPRPAMVEALEPDSSGPNKPAAQRAPHRESQSPPAISADLPPDHPGDFVPAVNLDSSNNKIERREASYQEELLHLFCERGRLVALLGVLFVPVYTLFYYFLSPDATSTFMPVQGLLIGVLIALNLMFRYVDKVIWARLLSLAGYAFFCMGAAAVMAMASYNQFAEDNGSLRALQFTVLASYGQIMLSILLLPYSLWETIFVAAMAAAALVWSLWWSVPNLAEPVYLSQFFILGSTMLLVMCVAHFQAILRRRVFDAAFELAESAGQLQRLTVQDAVTEGYNRRHLETMLNGELVRAARFSHQLTVIMFDLDNFKTVNDTKGHNTGDEVLREIWRAADTTVREVDTVGRYGGDEFVIILPETGREAAAALAERLQENVNQFLSNRFGAHALEAQVTISVGVFTLRPAENVTFEYVIQQADEKLYEAKRNGKNQIAT